MNYYTHLILISCFAITYANIDSLKTPVINVDKHKEFSVGVGFLRKSNQSPMEVYSMKRGVVVSTSNEPMNYTNLGKFVIIEHNINDNNGNDHNYYSLYAMLSEVYVNDLDSVIKGSKIGLIGPTGPLKEVTKDEVFIAIFTLHKDDIVENMMNSKAAFVHNVYWYDINKIFDRDK